MMGFVEAVKKCLSKYCNFKGRARRSEFWWFMLFLLIVYLAGSYLMGLLASLVPESFGMDASRLAIILVTMLMLAFMIPVFAVLTRRLHDTGRGGWWVLVLSVVGLIYGISYFYIMWPLLDKMSTDPYELASEMTGIMLESPTLATAFSFSGIVLFILVIILFVFTLLDSKWGENKYGPSPKYQ